MKYILTIIILLSAIAVAEAQGFNPEYQKTYEVPDYIRESKQYKGW